MMTRTVCPFSLGGGVLFLRAPTRHLEPNRPLSNPRPSTLTLDPRPHHLADLHLSLARCTLHYSPYAHTHPHTRRFGRSVGRSSSPSTRFSLSSTTMNAHGYVEVSPTEEREAKNAMRGAKLGLGISLLCFTAGYLSTNLTQVSMGPMLPPHATLYAMPRHAMPPCQSNTTTMPLPGKAPSRTTHPPPRHSRSTPLHRPAPSLDSRPPPRRRLSSLGRRRLCRT